MFVVMAPSPYVVVVAVRGCKKEGFEDGFVPLTLLSAKDAISSDGLSTISRTAGDSLIPVAAGARAQPVDDV
jgi:hypothetical protein